MKKTKIVSLVLFIGVILLSLGGCDTYTVKYQITGPSTTAKTVTYENEAYGTDEISNVPIPWEKIITVDKNFVASCTVTLDAGNTNTYTVKIFVDDKEVTRSSGTRFVVAVRSVR